MSRKDAPAVLEIIETHDDEDAEWAAEVYSNRGHHGQFVLTKGKRVAGVSGYSLADGTDNAYWISWTYINEESQRQGLGTALLEHLLARLKEEGARKVFVSTSDYHEEDSNVYANAVQLYDSAGFQLEVKTPDFYEKGESQLIYGLLLDAKSPPPIEFADRSRLSIGLTRLFRLEETEDCAGLDWEFVEEASFTVEELTIMLNEAKTAEARCLFVSFASDLTQALPILERCQMKEAGRLKDFWATGIDDVRYSVAFR